MNNKMKREIEITADGSSTLYVPSMNEHYHSINGAIQESEHVFIDAGLLRVEKRDIHILEIGFGTGLNAFLTLKEILKNKDLSVYYHTIELYPLELSLIEKLNYGEMICPEQKELFLSLHTAPWGKPNAITDRFTLHKLEGDCNKSELPGSLDLIYFDAFAPEKQPEMWTPAIFDKLYISSSPEAILVTYCAKGEVRRMMQAAGFLMERLPGPPGKRHMLFGKKIAF